MTHLPALLTIGARVVAEMSSRSIIFLALGVLFLLSGLVIKKPLARLTGSLGAVLFLGIVVLTVALGEMESWNSTVWWIFCPIVAVIWLGYTRWYLKRIASSDLGLLETERKSIPGSVVGGIIFLLVGLFGELTNNNALKPFSLLGLVNFFSALWFYWNIRLTSKRGHS